MFNKITKKSPQDIEPIQPNRQNDVSVDNDRENERRDFYTITSISNSNFAPRKNDHFEIEENKSKIEVKEGKEN